MYAKLLFGKALFLNQDHERAMIEAQKLKERLESAKVDEVELGDMRNQVGLLLRKVQLELTNKNRVGNINDAAYLGGKTPVAATAPAKEEAKATIDRKYDWYQNATHLFLSFKVSGPTVASGTKVVFTDNQITLTPPEGETMVFNLTHAIIPQESTSSPSPKKLELKLRKLNDGSTWLSVE